MKRKKEILTAGIVIVALIALTAIIYLYATSAQKETGETAGYIDISPSEAKALMESNPDLIVIDVSPAYSEGHLPGAVNYYIGDGSLDAAISNLDKEAVYLVYCHIMSASVAGSQKLVDAGFMNVYRLEGEYDAWVEAGYGIEQ